MPSASHAAFSSPGSDLGFFRWRRLTSPGVLCVSPPGAGARCTSTPHMGPAPSTVSWSVPQQPVVAGFREVKERCGVLNVKFPGFGGLRWETEGFMGMGGRG